ncbi:MAG TPA: hypothetical protein VFA97_01885 [Gaiellaceae bacterium]|nr:hypothetical protein [Gaiellaceae bacterium]
MSESPRDLIVPTLLVGFIAANHLLFSGLTAFDGAAILLVLVYYAFARPRRG